MKMSRKSKKPHTPSKLVLEEIIGLTTKNANGLASAKSNASCVYLAGCVVVAYNVDSGTQSHLMASHRMPRPLSCVAVSQDGSFVAAGESGNQPAVLVWESATLAFIAELKGHQHGVTCIAFSPDGKHMVSVGFPHDGYICLWDWRSGTFVTKLKASSSCSAVSSVCFSPDASFILTAGKKHLKFWTVASSTKSRSNNGARSLSMYGKPVNLGPRKGCSFISVTSSSLTDGSFAGFEHAGEFFPIYALTEEGVLWLLHSGLSVRSVDLKVKRGFALSAFNKLIACACSNGIVKLFATVTLEYAGSLQYSETKSFHEASKISSHESLSEKDFQPSHSSPDAIACQFLSAEKLSIVYADHSLYIWDIHDVNKPTRCCVLVSHSACIWDIKNLSCDYMHDPSLACVAQGCSGGVSFATCSADGSIRLWDLTLQPDSLKVTSSKHGKGHPPFYTKPSDSPHFVSAGIFERDSVESSVSTQGFRSMAVSPDGNYLAAGDCLGNLHVYNLCTSEFICLQDAHEAEILSLSFSAPNNDGSISEKDTTSHYLLASGGRDRRIHLYDVRRNFDLIGSVDDHSAAVTSVRLAADGHKILSCSADRSLVFRDVAASEAGCKILRRHHQLASHGTVYDIAIDPSTKVAITVGQNKKINTFDIAAGKLLKSFKQDGAFGDPIKVIMDPSCSYLVCSYSSRSICMYDFVSGELVAQAVGLGKDITGVVFLPDCRHLISVGGDGCIFVWKVPALLSSRILERMKDKTCPLSPTCMAKPISRNQLIFCEGSSQSRNPKHISMLENSSQVEQRMRQKKGGSQQTSAFKFSISRLPRWAQAKLGGPVTVPSDFELTLTQQEEQGISFPLIGDGGGFASVSPEVRTPTKYSLKGSEPCLGSMCRRSADSQFSPMSRETISSAMDKRWLTIYTVCLDLPPSPDVWSLKDMKMPVSAPNLLQDPAVEIASNTKDMESSQRDQNHVVDVGQDTTCSVHAKLSSGSRWKASDQLGIDDERACGEIIEVLELSSTATESGAQAEANARSCSIKSQDNDLFDQHFGNLSVVPKMEERKSSARKKYSARFVVRRDCVMGSMRSFGTPVQKFGGEIFSCEEVAVQVSSGDPSILMQEERKITDAHEQVHKYFTINMPNVSPSAEVTNFRDRKQYSPTKTEIHERMIACKKTLLNLDAAADNALHLFSMGDNSSELGAQVYDKASELLPLIAEKVHMIAKLVETSKKGSCRQTTVEVPRIGPLLGKVSETLLKNVVENTE